MLNQLLLKIGITKKITRSRLEKFLTEQKDTVALTLDLGCGTSAPYKKYFPNRVGFDNEAGPNIDVVGDAHGLPFEDEKFDIILCTEVLEHLHSPEIAVSEMKRVLRPGGKLILTTRFIFPLHDVPNDYYRYTKYGLKYLFRDWETLEFEEETNTLETIAVLLQRIGYQCEILSFKPFKIVFFLLARMILPFSFIITKQFGEMGRKNIETNIMTSGYYMVCKKL